MKIISKIFWSGKWTKPLIAAYFALSIGAGFLVIAANERLAVLFNEHIVAGEQGFLPAILVVAGLFIVVFGAKLLGTYIQQSLQWLGEERLKGHFIRKLLGLEAKYFADKEPPAIWTMLHIATQQAANILGSILGIIAGAIMAIFYVSVVFMIDVWAGLFTLAAFPVYVLLTRGLGKKFEAVQRDMGNHSREIAVAANEAIANINNVKAKNAHEFFTGRILTVQSKITRVWRVINTLSGYLNNILPVIGIIAPVFILFAAMQFSDALRVDIGIVLILYINIPLFLSNFGWAFSEIRRMGSYRPGLEILMELQAEPDELTGTVPLTAFESLETHNVTVQFAENRRVKIPDMHITRGEKVMLYGESGVGKSTLFNILMGFITDFEGAVRINGRNLAEYDISTVRTVMGIAFQFTNAITVSLRDNIQLGRDIKENADPNTLLDIAHLNNIADARTDDTLHTQTLSGGEKSRVGLAQALFANPDLLLIDETFSNVDEAMESAILEKLFARYPDKTFLCISHRQASQKYFDKAVEFVG